MHEHYDAEGNLTGTTVVTRESEWDDDTRDRVLALDAYESLRCPCGCGLLVTEAHKEQPFIVDTFTCQANRALKQAERKAGEDAKKDRKPEGWDDGVFYTVKPYKKPETEEGPRG